MIFEDLLELTLIILIGGEILLCEGLTDANELVIEGGPAWFNN